MSGYGSGSGIAFVLVLFILLVIISHGFGGSHKRYGGNNQNDIDETPETGVPI